MRIGKRWRHRGWRFASKRTAQPENRVILVEINNFPAPPHHEHSLQQMANNWCMQQTIFSIVNVEQIGMCQEMKIQCSGTWAKRQKWRPWCRGREGQEVNTAPYPWNCHFLMLKKVLEPNFVPPLKVTPEAHVPSALPLLRQWKIQSCWIQLSVLIVMLRTIWIWSQWGVSIHDNPLCFDYLAILSV